MKPLLLLFTGLLMVTEPPIQGPAAPIPVQEPCITCPIDTLEKQVVTLEKQVAILEAKVAALEAYKAVCDKFFDEYRTWYAKTYPETWAKAQVQARCYGPNCPLTKELK